MGAKKTKRLTPNAMKMMHGLITGGSPSGAMKGPNFKGSELIKSAKKVDKRKVRGAANRMFS